jgi:serine/threonine protein kinase
MKPDRWNYLQNIFHGALSRPAAEREAFLDQACDGDQEMHREVASLLAEAERDTNFMAQSVRGVAADLFAEDPAHSLAGRTIANYQVLSLLGTGGMGEVYLAKDTRLNRKVAIKFLYTESTADPRGRHCLLNEARAAAALDHPNICTIYEAAEAENLSFIVMQYIEGETLAARLRREPVQLSEALTIALQILQALSEAHARGVIHRDIKPQNILLTPRGEVKVLDFGLAKRLPEHGYETEAPVGMGFSQAGLVEGTAGYMSPEQVRGREVDHRTDLFSFGIVFYELLTRQTPFVGETTIRRMSAIVESDPPALRHFIPDLPLELEDIIRRLLAKDPDARAQTAREIEIELERLRNSITDVSGRGRFIRRVAVYGAFVALAGLAIWLAGRKPPSTPSQLTYTQLTNFSDGATAPILSPDGKMLAFIRGGSSFLSRGQIWVKELPDGRPRQLTDEPWPISTPYFSPDGSHIAYTVTDVPRAAWDTWIVPVHGGPARKLFSNMTGLTWIGEQEILFSEIRSGLHLGVMTASESRSDSRIVYFPAHERAMAHYSYLSPDRRWVLIVEMDHTAIFRSCRLVPFDGSSTGRLVGPEGTCTAAAWSADGNWMYFTVRINGDSHLWRQRFPDGVPEQLTFGPTQESGIAMARTGHSLITTMGLRQDAVWIHDRKGDRAVSPEGDASRPMFNAASNRIYYLLRRSPASATNELWVTDLTTGKSTTLLTGFAIDGYDISADETEVVVATKSEGKPAFWVAELDGRAAPVKIGVAGNAPFFGPNGEIVFQAVENQKNYLYKTSIDRLSHQKVTPRPISNIRYPSVDGAWVMVIASSEEGTTTNLAIPVSGGESVRICAGACVAQWSPNGRFFQIAFDAVDRPEKGDTFVLPVAPGQMVPSVPPTGFRSAADVEKVAGVRRIPLPGLTPGPDPGTYAYIKTTLSQNLYRIDLPR